jgi:outer membrane lipoprotein carrier protein
MHRPDKMRVARLPLLVAMQLIVSAAALPARTEAQGDAATVAARVQAFYDRVDTIQASFRQTYYSRVYGRYQRSRGRMTLSEPGRLRFDYATPSGQVIASDGRRLTVYEPGDPGEPGQFVRRDVRSESLPAAFGLLTGRVRLADHYRFTLGSSRAYGWDGDVLILTPRRPSPDTRRIILFVDDHPDRLGFVHRLRIDDPEGNRNKFELTGVRLNRPVPSTLFSFEPPPGSRPIR